MGKTRTAHVVDIGDEVSTVVKSIHEDLEGMTSLPSIGSIYRVPEPLRKIKPEAYTPRMVSIGPFHRNKEHLKPMEAHKLRYLSDFLRRKSPPTLHHYVKAMTSSEDTARRSYSEIIDISKNDFVKMMLIDGCFILELVLRTNLEEPILIPTWMSHVIKCDLLLMENQLPFFVLERLYNLLTENSHLVNGFGPHTFSYHAHLFLENFVQPSPRNTSKDLSIQVTRRLAKKDQSDVQAPLLTEDEERSVERHTSHSKHLLDFVRALFLRSPSGTANTEEQNRGKIVFTRSATELNEAGVKFEKVTKCLLDITFTKGALKIPTMRIEDWTESLFRNLIAFEQSCDANPQDITYYAAFMDGLINSSKDVELLRKQGIIESLLGEPEEMAALFNDLLKEVIIVEDNYKYSRVCRDVENYYKIPTHKWKASLLHNYCNTPWAFISFLAAVILLILTVAQTICSIIQVI